MNAESMRPIAKIATGFVFVFGTVRLNNFDLLLDPLGWGFCVSGLDALRRSPGDRAERAQAFAAAMIFVSFVPVIVFTAGTGSDPLAFLIREAIGFAGTTGALVAVWLVVDVVVERIRRWGHVSRAAQLDVLRWGAVGAGAIGLAAQYGHATLGAVPGVVGFVGTMALVVMLYASAGLPTRR